MKLVICIFIVVAVLCVLTRLLASRLGRAVVLAGLSVVALFAFYLAAGHAPAPVRVSTAVGQAVTAAESPNETKAVSAGSEPRAKQAPAEPGVKPLAETREPGIPLDEPSAEPVVPPRPAWVESKPKRTGKVHTTAVSSGPQEQLKECRTKLDGELQKAVAAYVDWYLGRFYGDEGKPSQFVRYDLRFIRDHLVRPENNHEEKLELSFGPMYQAHALVSFDPEFRKQLDAQRPAIERQWKQRAVKGRLAGTGLVFGVILFLLAVVSGYFRLDTATRGYYTGRLQLLAAAAILAVVIAGAILAKGVPWM